LGDISTGAFQVVNEWPDPINKCETIIAENTNADVQAFFTDLRAALLADPSASPQSAGQRLLMAAEALQTIADREAFLLDVRTDPEGLQVVVDHDGQVIGE
jgi:hypothetical protein